MPADPNPDRTVAAAVAPVSRAWVEFSRDAVDSALKAQERMLSSAGFLMDGTVESASPSVDYERSDWTVDRDLADPDRISVGDTVTFEKQLSARDVRTFADLSGDTNRLHLDPSFAAETRFEGQIVHGALGAGLISAALARFPGVVIYLSQELSYQRPVPVDSTVTAICEVLEEIDDRTFRLSTDVIFDEEPVISGEAMILVDPLPEA